MKNAVICPANSESRGFYRARGVRSVNYLHNAWFYMLLKSLNFLFTSSDLFHLALLFHYIVPCIVVLLVLVLFIFKCQYILFVLRLKRIHLYIASDISHKGACFSNWHYEIYFFCFPVVCRFLLRDAGSPPIMTVRLIICESLTFSLALFLALSHNLN